MFACGYLPQYPRSSATEPVGAALALPLPVDLCIYVTPERDGGSALADVARASSGDARRTAVLSSATHMLHTYYTHTAYMLRYATYYRQAVDAPPSVGAPRMTPRSYLSCSSLPSLTGVVE